MATDTERRRMTVYVDANQYLLIDDILSRLLREHGVPRDQSMLIRAILADADQFLTDPEKLAALAERCRATPPQR